MKDDIDPLGDLLAKMGIADIATYNLKVVIFGYFFQPPPVVEGVVEGECPDVAAHVQQGFGEVGAYKTVCAGDEDIFVCKHHF
jgi:hypothetical protein